MATDEVWKKLKYFKKHSLIDRWGNVDLISDDLLLILDDFRHYIRKPVLVTSGTGGKHSENSQHSYGRAVDVCIPDFNHSPVDLCFTAMRFPFTGIGYYPFWMYNGEICGGLHLDIRPLNFQKDETRDC